MKKKQLPCDQTEKGEEDTELSDQHPLPLPFPVLGGLNENFKAKKKL